MILTYPDVDAPKRKVNFRRSRMAITGKNNVNKSNANNNQAPFTLDELETLANRYAPVVRFHPNEQYFMCTVDWYLSKSTLYGKDGSVKQSPAVTDLPVGTADDGSYWLKMSDDAKKGDLSIARIYVHAYWQPGNDYIDLQYWFCYGYNGPGTLHVYNWFTNTDVNLSPLGEHWIDWEQVTIRIKTDSQEVLGLFLSQHGEGQWITDLKQFDRQKDQFIVYASNNGHAVYAKPGTNPTNSYEVLGLGAYLRNDTSTGGQSFDSAGKLDIVSADFITGFTEPRWLQFPYRYGQGTNSYLTQDAVAGILQGLLGPFSWIGGAFISGLAEVILPVIKFDDTNGVYGPQTQSYWTSSKIPRYYVQNYYSDYTTNQGAPPDICYFKDQYHIFFQDRNGTGIMHIISSDGVNWSRPISFYTGYTTTAGPCCVVFENLLHVFFRDGSGNGLLHMVSTDGINWSGANPFYLGINCDNQPAAAVLNGKLCVAMIDHGGNGIMCSVQTGVNGTWNNIYTGYNTNPSSPVGLIAFNNQFHLFFQDHNGKGIMHITSPDGLKWSGSEVFYTGFNASSGPAAIVAGKWVYIFFRDGSGDGMLYIQSTDATNWSEPPCWYLGQNGDTIPRVAGNADGTDLCVTYIDAGGNGIMCSYMELW